MNDQEELDGPNGRFEFPQEFKVIYEGEFKDSMFHGKGRLIHTDTGNIYEGEFYQHHKDGPCTFKIASTGQIYKGLFEFNYESVAAEGDYGPRI